ncbi:sensor histidine kinase [Actinocatenispora rupis]|uniref:sensor histidine kinase n=1 Tax=Actinocatenispora rupis TaxID=519421 RepID=UPI0035709E9B
MVPIAAAVVVPVVLALRLRRTLAHRDGQRAWQVERELAGAADDAVRTERERIARELHDIIGHTVSVMVVQAGSARSGATDDGELTAALRAVEDSGREAMTELRHMLALLAPAPDGTDAELAPQPGLSRLSTLIDRMAFAGLPVDVTIGGEPRPLPPGIDVTAYRVVQEALTNALKHAAPDTRAEVEVRYTERNLRLEVLTTGPSLLAGTGRAPASAGDGRGLTGLRERVRVYGGDLYAGRRLGGGYRVRTRIPLERP